MRVVASVKAVEPPADDIRLFNPILLDAYAKVCPTVTDVRSAIRGIDQTHRLIMVRCSGSRIKGVRLTFTGVRVPDLAAMGFMGMEEPQSLLAMLGLRWHITHERPRHGSSLNMVVHQQPTAGKVVPFGTAVRVVIR